MAMLFLWLMVIEKAIFPAGGWQSTQQRLFPSADERDDNHRVKPPICIFV